MGAISSGDSPGGDGVADFVRGNRSPQLSSEKGVLFPHQAPAKLVTPFCCWRNIPNVINLEECEEYPAKTFSRTEAESHQLL
ncbi:hypothetical protein GN956_G19798 [Arapaima gigas]